MQPPEIGSKWLHKNGSEYVVYDVTTLESSRKDLLPLMISCRRLRDKTKWSIPLTRWHEYMSYIIQITRQAPFDYGELS